MKRYESYLTQTPVGWACSSTYYHSGCVDHPDISILIEILNLSSKLKSVKRGRVLLDVNN